MKLIEFPEQTDVIAKNQPQYNPMPAWLDREDDQGRLICCWKLSLKERVKILLTGKVWHHILTFGNSVQPQLLQVENPFRKAA